MTSRRFGALNVVTRLARLREDQAKQELAEALHAVMRQEQMVIQREGHLRQIGLSSDLDFGQTTHEFKAAVARGRREDLLKVETLTDSYNEQLSTYLEAHRARSFVERVLDGKISAYRYDQDRREAAELFELSGAIRAAVGRRDAGH